MTTITPEAVHPGPISRTWRVVAAFVAGAALAAGAAVAIDAATDSGSSATPPPQAVVVHQVADGGCPVIHGPC